MFNSSKECSFGEISKDLQIKLGKKRWKHVAGVVETAKALAKYYDADVEKAKLAALLHDCARYLNVMEMLAQAKRMSVEYDEIMKKEPVLLHARLGAKIAQENYGVKDEEVLRAVELHTLGNDKMKLLDKIIYVADYIEPNRDYPKVEKLRKLAYEDLDRAVFRATEQTIAYVLQKGMLLHPQSVLTRNAFLPDRG